MMKAMGLKSPAPIQSRLKHLQEKGYISWQEGKARTLQIAEEILEGIPIMGSVAAGGLIETFTDVSENLDLSEILKKKDVFALTVNGDSMIDAFIAHGDMVLMEPINDSYSLKNGTIVSAMVPGLGTTLKYFIKKGDKIKFMATKKSYNADEIGFLKLIKQPKNEVLTGDVGYLITGIKDAKEVKVGNKGTFKPYGVDEKVKNEW